MKTCACGCGREVKGRGVYFHGHRPQETVEDTRERLCECGCGQPLPQPKTRSGRYHRSRFIAGHHIHVQAVPPHTYVPEAGEVPSGLCECGCGQQTPIATYTCRKRRVFRGHPMPRLSGHGQQKRGPESPHFTGERRTAGYVYVYMPDHPQATRTGYVPQHRVVWEAANGRLLSRAEQVHHVNGVRDDNRPENLIALSRADHRRLHALGHEVAPKTRAKHAESTRRAWADGRMGPRKTAT